MKRRKGHTVEGCSSPKLKTVETNRGEEDGKGEREEGEDRERG